MEEKLMGYKRKPGFYDYTNFVGSIIMMTIFLY